jgi:hypothetical protein
MITKLKLKQRFFKMVLGLGLIIAGTGAATAQSNGMYDKIVYQHTAGSTRYTINYTITVTPESAVMVITPNWGSGTTIERYVDNDQFANVLMSLSLANLGTRANPCGNMVGGSGEQISLFDQGRQLYSGTANGNCGTMSGAYGAVIYQLRSLFPDFNRQMAFYNAQIQSMNNGGR